MRIPDELDVSWPEYYLRTYGAERFPGEPKLLRYFLTLREGLSGYFTTRCIIKHGATATPPSVVNRVVQSLATLTGGPGLVSQMFDAHEHKGAVSQAKQIIFFPTEEVGKLVDIISASITKSFENHIRAFSVLAGQGEYISNEIVLDDFPIAQEPNVAFDFLNPYEALNDAIDKFAQIAVIRICCKLEDPEFIEAFSARAKKTHKLSFPSQSERFKTNVFLYLNLILRALTYSSSVEVLWKGVARRSTLSVNGETWYYDSIYAKSAIMVQNPGSNDKSPSDNSLKARLKRALRNLDTSSHITYGRLDGKSRWKYRLRLSLGDFDIHHNCAMWSELSTENSIRIVRVLLHDLNDQISELSDGPTRTRYTKFKDEIQTLCHKYDEDNNHIMLQITARKLLIAELQSSSVGDIDRNYRASLQQGLDALRAVTVDYFKKLYEKAQRYPFLKYQIADEAKVYITYLSSNSFELEHLGEMLDLQEPMRRLIINFWKEQSFWGRIKKAFENAKMIVLPREANTGMMCTRSLSNEISEFAKARFNLFAALEAVDSWNKDAGVDRERQQEQDKDKDTGVDRERQQEQDEDVVDYAALFGRKGYVVEGTNRDGNCFFHAAIAQLSTHAVNHDYDHITLRYAAANYIDKHWDDFVAFIPGDSPQNREEFIEQLKQPGEWAGNIIMQATALVLECNITVVYINVECPDYVINVSRPCSNIIIGYTGGHYVSLQASDRAESASSIEEEAASTVASPPADLGAYTYDATSRSANTDSISSQHFGPQ